MCVPYRIAVECVSRTVRTGSCAQWLCTLKELLPLTTEVELTVLWECQRCCTVYTLLHDSGSRIPCNLHPHLFTWIKGLKFVISAQRWTVMYSHCMLSHGVLSAFGVGGDLWWPNVWCSPCGRRLRHAGHRLYQIHRSHQQLATPMHK